jgi:hypothetical protein
MSGILDFVTGLLSGIGGLFTGGLTQLLNQLTENLIAVVLLAFAVALGVFAIVYLNRRRRTLDQQRMAVLIKGLHYAGVAREVLTQPTEDARDHLLRGLRWLFGALGISSAMYGFESLQPMATEADALRGAVIGLIPAAIGIAHLVFSRMSPRQPARPVVLPRSASSLYRAAAYRSAGRRF